MGLTQFWKTGRFAFGLTSKAILIQYAIGRGQTTFLNLIIVPKKFLNFFNHWTCDYLRDNLATP